MAILGISAHKTTIYHTQTVGLLNSGWLADPVQTAAMQASVLGSDPARAVLNAIESGTGYNLKQYYPYATRRFGKRNCLWNLATINSTGSVEFGLNRERLISIIPSLADREFRIVHDVDYFSYSGSKVFEDISKRYGWNDFSEPLSDGTNIVISGAEIPYTYLETQGDLKNSWVVGTETSKNIPVVILDPTVDKFLITSEYYLLAQEEFNPDLSGGVVYWLSSKGFESQSKTNIKRTTYTEAAYQLLGITSNLPEETNRISDWKNESETSVSINTEDLPDDENDGREIEQLPLSEPKENVTIFYQQLVNKTQVNVINGKPVYEYEVETWEESGVINYDSVDYVWATKTDESHVGVKQYFSTQENYTSNFLGSNKDKWFKFYPYLPIKEYEQEVLNFDKATKYLNALREQSKAELENETESDAPKSNRLGTKVEQSKKKDTDNSISRVLASKSRYTRRIKVRGNLGIEPSDERHLTQMGNYLNTDYKETAATLAVNEDYNKIYHASLLPAVTLGSNFDEVNDYWWAFLNRLYLKIGQSSYLKFEEAVKQLPDNCTFNDVLSLPRTELSYGIEGLGQFGGFISFTFIRKFKISGSIRTTKRKRRLKEIKCGLLTQLKNLSGKQLKEALLEPSKELMINNYRTSPVSGKQYNVGGGNLYTSTKTYISPSARPIYQDSDKASLIFEEYGYTFFCKDLGENELEVIAVAGLIGGVTRSGYVIHNHGSTSLDGITVMARASHELSMFWERNRKKYIEKTLSEKIDVHTLFTSGSKRKKLETKVQTFFLVPLDYRTVSRMSGTTIMRLSQRAVVTHTWVKVRHRRIRGWVKIVIQIIGAIIAVVGAIYGDGGATGMSIMAMAKALATAVAVQLVVKYTVTLLIRTFGFKGFLAILVTIIVIVVAAVLGGRGISSSLPYASQTATSQVATNIGSQTLQQSATQGILNNIKDMVQNLIKDTMKEISQMTGKQLLENTANLVSKMADSANSYLAQENQKIANQLKQATEEYEKHIGELQELQELNQERTAPYDVKAVMESLTNKAKLIDPDTYLTMTLLSDNVMASEEYISQFIRTKLNLEPSSFDPVGSLDFSLAMKD